MATATYTATMRTRKSNSSSNYHSSEASQEFYQNTYNFIGILCFSGMNLANKVITGISLTITAAKAGYGAWADRLLILGNRTIKMPPPLSQVFSIPGMLWGHSQGPFMETRLPIPYQEIF